MTLVSEPFACFEAKAWAAPFIQRYADARDMPEFVYRQTVRVHLKKVLSQGHIWIRMHTDRLAGLLNDGRLPTYFDNPRGELTEAAAIRIANELMMFQAAPEDGVVFGYLSEKAPHVFQQLSMFGPIAVRVKRPESATFAGAIAETFRAFPSELPGVQDSVAASLLSDPSELSWPWSAGCPLDLQPGTLHASPGVLFEVQLHKGVTPADIDAAHFFNTRAGYMFISKLSALGTEITKGGANAFEFDH